MSESFKLLRNMTEWKLLSGSHEFPGPEGGTCINEAAIVAAGLPYNKVSGLANFPPCFSPITGLMALYINDALNDEVRQKMMRYVTKLAGSRGTDDIEKARCEMVAVRIVNRMADEFYGYHQDGLATMCLNARNILDVITIGKLVPLAYYYSDPYQTPSKGLFYYMNAFATIAVKTRMMSSIESPWLTTASHLGYGWMKQNRKSLEFGFKTTVDFCFKLLDDLIDFPGAPQQTIKENDAVSRMVAAIQKNAMAYAKIKEKEKV